MIPIKIGDKNEKGHIWNGFEYLPHYRYAEMAREIAHTTGSDKLMKLSILTNNFKSILNTLDPNPERSGIAETPLRASKAWEEWTSGYYVDIPKLFKVFDDGGETYDQMITVKDIPIYSHCEHHLASIFGTATISYIPDGKIVGLSKLSRVADAFARRLQVQERLTDQIADAINDNLKPKGVGVIIKARHLCMESRGICQQGHHTVTTALRGVILTESLPRSEFMNQ